jgi:hypothetical protein
MGKPRLGGGRCGVHWLRKPGTGSWGLSLAAFDLAQGPVIPRRWGAKSPQGRGGRWELMASVSHNAATSGATAEPRAGTDPALGPRVPTTGKLSPTQAVFPRREVLPAQHLMSKTASQKVPKTELKTV